MSAEVIQLTPRQLAEFLDCDPRLQLVVLDAAGIWPQVTLRFTSVHRSLEENAAANAETLIHVEGPPYRAVDLGIAGVGQVVADRIAFALNKKWEYDDSRPHLNVAISAPHGTGSHVHLQVHPRTKIRKTVPALQA